MSGFDPRVRRNQAAANIAIALYRIGQAIHVLLRRAAQAQGLSATQAQALLFLLYARPGVRTIGGLAERLACTPATASEVADALALKGLIERRPSAADRRTVWLRLTAQGTAMAHRLDGALATLEGAVSNLDGDTQAMLQQLLRRVVRGLNEHGLIRVYEMCWECRFFRPNAHPDDPVGPHHCAFMDAPLPVADTFTECPDYVPVA